ncbi:GL21299 [Drosophila persimilis]|uniref:Uncharacterized protein n=2 Tax=pseudoobscura subgroup TaxID=32358 RepID=A0A6I8V4K5_DROPS|nr:uncharacterized protein LOC6603467 [Drosophila persimilis]XP_002138704.1 uncharacterized protein LOC6898699 [Drosophila pseudoobscura]XP_017150619.1 uncharacterized protein LOC108160868 [Drosophila miranda]EDW40106.1 GL21299 [Drosophila persimilis]
MLLQQTENSTKFNQHFTECWNQLSLQRRSDILSVLSTISFSAAKMATMPQGAFAACKIRQQFNEREMIVSRMRSGTDKTAVDNNTAQREYSPVKYNDKLMNSIWGLYNRYSPHNVKKNEYAPTK